MQYFIRSQICMKSFPGKFILHPILNCSDDKNPAAPRWHSVLKVYLIEAISVVWVPPNCI